MRSSRGLNTDSHTCSCRGEDVPMPYGKSHSFTAALLGHSVKGAALAEVHHSLFQPQFQALQYFSEGLLRLCRKCWCLMK